MSTRVVFDTKDDPFVFCALAGGASHLLTADNDLLVLGVVDTVTVLTPEAFLAFLRALSSAWPRPGSPTRIPADSEGVTRNRLSAARNSARESPAIPLPTPCRGPATRL